MEEKVAIGFNGRRGGFMLAVLRDNDGELGCTRPVFEELV
jgi:hypothetical protein